MLYLELREFINLTYEFNCNPKYKGFFGKLRVFFDKSVAEDKNEKESHEYYRSDPIFLFSNPISKEILQEYIKQEIIKDSFGRAFLKLLHDKDKDPVEVYKKAHIDRKLFSKIRTQDKYVPSKKTIIALVIGAELNYDETQEILRIAGFTLSRYILFDVIIEFFIKNKIYNIDLINGYLDIHNQPLLD